MAITKIIADSITSGAIANTPAFHATNSATQDLTSGAYTKVQLLPPLHRINIHIFNMEDYIKMAPNQIYLDNY
jgi:hypothetical protein